MTYYDARSNSKVVRDYPKECGKKRDIDNFKHYLDQSAFVLDGTYTCTDK